jgi:hypothetical protein
MKRERTRSRRRFAAYVVECEGVWTVMTGDAVVKDGFSSNVAAWHWVDRHTESRSGKPVLVRDQGESQ